MKSLWIIVRREYVTRVRRKAFIIGTLAMPIVFVAVVALLVLATMNDQSHTKALIVDRAGLITRLDSGSQAWVPTHPAAFPVRELLAYRFSPEALSDSAFLASDFDLMVEFDDGILQSAKGMLYYDVSPSLQMQSSIQRDLSRAIERFRVKNEATLDFETYQRLSTSVSLVGQDIVTRDGNANARGIIGFGFSLLLFMFILVYGMHVMRGVIEEKSNRIVEVIISTVRPAELMLGKVLGIGLVGLTQIVALMGSGWLVMSLGGWGLAESGVLAELTGAAPGAQVDLTSFMESKEDLRFLLDVNWGLMIGAAAFFFVMGFVLYASLFAAVGAMVDQESDAQYLLLPVMSPLMVSYFLSTAAMSNPEGMLAVIGSYVPFTAPIMMLIRIPVGVMWWEVALAALGVLLTAWGMLVLAGRVYRTGILMYGKKASFREVWRWIRYRG
jgi:ABC-2 type transport system permease protein